MANNNSWKKIFEDYQILKHNFNKGPFYIDAEQIKISCQDFKKVGEKEVRVLCKMDSRSDRPEVMSENGLFLLPVRNGRYAIIKGDGFLDIPEITTPPIEYESKLDFEIISADVGNSEMQHLDFAYAVSLIRTFIDDKSLVLSIRGRKRTPEFSFLVNNHELNVKSVQTEVDAGFEGRDRLVLIEAKNSKTEDTIIRQLFYPFRQWKTYTNKNVDLLFFEKRGKEYLIWQYDFKDDNDYNSIFLVKSARFIIK